MYFTVLLSPQVRNSVQLGPTSTPSCHNRMHRIRFPISRRHKMTLKILNFRKWRSHKRKGITTIPRRTRLERPRPYAELTVRVRTALIVARFLLKTPGSSTMVGNSNSIRNKITKTTQRRRGCDTRLGCLSPANVDSGTLGRELPTFFMCRHIKPIATEVKSL
jgi:hypothetical protein